jgi:microsomal epoxide hydrolase
MSVDTLTDREKAGQARSDDFMKMGSAYSFEHATRPATIGLALDSSPLALLAWIGEKFLSWSDESPSLETILESVSLYWYTESMGRGIFPYRGVSLVFPVKQRVDDLEMLIEK